LPGARPTIKNALFRRLLIHSHIRLESRRVQSKKVDNENVKDEKRARSRRQVRAALPSTLCFSLDVLSICSLDGFFLSVSPSISRSIPLLLRCCTWRQHAWRVRRWNRGSGGRRRSAALALSAARGPARVGVDGPGASRRGGGAGCAGRAERAAAALDLDAGPGAEVEALAGTAVGRIRVGGDCAARAIVPVSTSAAGLLGAASPSADKITAVFCFRFCFSFVKRSPVRVPRLW